MSNGLTTEERKTIAAVFAQVPAIERAVLFGSRAMGLGRGNSDVDIALYGDKLGLPDILHTASLLEETPLPYHFDLISRASITSPDLLEHIRQYGKEMYRKERNPQEKCSSERYIAGNFQEYELSDLCYYADGRAVVSDLDLDTYISTENMLPNKGGIIRSAGLPTVNQTQAYQVNDVLVSNIRPYFRKIWFADREGGCSNDVLVLRAKETCNPKFLYYLLSENAFFDYATATGKGTKMPRGDKKAIMCYSVPDMPLKYQVEIVATLSSLDEKIENNRKINQCLEQMAQAIFKSWFVDFEPWGGVMPNDWREGALGDYCSVKSGFAFKSSWWQESGIRVIKIKNITDSGFDFSGCSFVSEDKLPYAKEFVATAGDLLIAMTGATIGKFAIIPLHDETLLVNQRVGKFFLGKKPIDKLPFLWCLLKQDEVFSEIVNRGQGSAQPNISPTDIMTIPIIVPSGEVLSDFNCKLRSLFEKNLVNVAENQRLAELRDALLPRLMSGELSVADLDCAK